MPQILPFFSAVLGAVAAAGSAILGAVGTLGAFLTGGSLGAALLNIGPSHGMSFDQPPSKSEVSE